MINTIKTPINYIILDASEKSGSRISKCVLMSYQKNKGQNRNMKTPIYGTAQMAENDSKKHKFLLTRLRADRNQGMLAIIRSPNCLPAL